MLLAKHGLLVCAGTIFVKLYPQQKIKNPAFLFLNPHQFLTPNLFVQGSAGEFPRVWPLLCRKVHLWATFWLPLLVTL